MTLVGVASERQRQAPIGLWAGFGIGRIYSITHISLMSKLQNRVVLVGVGYVQSRTSVSDLIDPLPQGSDVLG